jgi:hypothetical protein
MARRISSRPSSRAKLTTAQLTLPAAFGSTYVGEAFDCTLCVNSELPEDADRRVTSVKVAAEMQTPSQTLPLVLHPENEEAAHSGIAHGESLQSIVNFDLREEGSHTLIVSISYNESIQSAGTTTVSGGRIRSFRKLYQFPVVSCSFRLPHTTFTHCIVGAVPICPHKSHRTQSDRRPEGWFRTLRSGSPARESRGQRHCHRTARIRASRAVQVYLDQLGSRSYRAATGSGA